VAVGAARPAIRHREPAGRRQQHRHRGGRACASGRLHAPPGRSANAINATLYDKLNFNFIRDIAPVASFIREPRHAGETIVPAKTFPSFIALRQCQSGKINFASGGNGTPPHVSGELFKMMNGALTWSMYPTAAACPR
jgi:tripartite-type tricarboxylate transporter receptor subunit TctC